MLIQTGVEKEKGRWPFDPPRLISRARMLETSLRKMSKQRRVQKCSKVPSSWLIMGLHTDCEAFVDSRWRSLHPTASHASYHGRDRCSSRWSFSRVPAIIVGCASKIYQWSHQQGQCRQHQAARPRAVWRESHARARSVLQKHHASTSSFDAFHASVCSAYSHCQHKIAASRRTTAYTTRQSVS